MKVPILRLKDVLITSIQFDLTDEEAIEFQNDLLEKSSIDGIVGVVIDVSSLDVVDSYMAKVLNDTARMIKLLGPQTVFCGMQPDVALTLIEMGRELVGVETALNLENGLEKIQRRIFEGESYD